MSEKSIVYGVGLALLASSAAGCIDLLAPADITTINSHVSKKDERWLEDVCAGRYASRNDDDKKYACNQLERMRAPQKALTASCEEIDKVYEDAPKNDEAFVSKMADKIAECGHYAYLFEHVVHWGNDGEGMKILVELEEKGKPVEAEFVKYMASHKGPAFFPVEKDRKNDVIFGLEHITKWLIKKGHTQHCGALAEAVTGGSIYARVSAMGYFKELKCKEGVPLAQELLLADLPGDRILGCDMLAVLGDKSVLEKVKIVADTDGFSEVKEEERDGRIWATKSFPVRDACLEAFGKIKLRN